MSFREDQISALKEKLDGSTVKQRKQGGSQVSYIEGHHAIREANRIFGFGEWDRFTERMDLIQCEQQEDKRWKVGYIAKVRVVVGVVVREGYGFGNGLNPDLGAAHELAVKEAETDAMKRALMTFGDQFGLALYDKGKENVAKGAPADNPDRKACFAILNSAGIKYEGDAKTAVLAFLSSGSDTSYESASDVPAEVWKTKRAALEAWYDDKKRISHLDNYLQAKAQTPA